MAGESEGRAESDGGFRELGPTELERFEPAERMGEKSEEQGEPHEVQLPRKLSKSVRSSSAPPALEQNALGWTFRPT